MSKVEIVGGKVLKFEGVQTSFLAGLSWRHEETKPDRKALFETGLRAGLGLWGGLRSTPAGSFQSVFMNPIDGFKPGKLIPLAAVVAEAHEGPWMGVYRLSDDLFWYIAVREHEILPDGDFIGDADAVGLRREAHLDIGEWSEFSGVVDDLLLMVVEHYKNTKCRLSKLERLDGNPILYAGIGLLTLVVAGGAYFLYHKNKAEKEMIAHHAAMMKQRALAEAAKSGKNKAKVVFPWSKKASAVAFLDACRSVWKTQPFTHAGWTLDRWECSVSDAGVVSVAEGWTRSGGLAVNAPGDLVLNDKTSRRTRDFGTVGLGVSGGLLPFDEDNRKLWTGSEVLCAKLSIISPSTATPKVGLPGMATGAPSGPVVDEPWTTTPFKFEFQVSPMIGRSVGNTLSAVKVLALSDLKWEGGVWFLSGEMYSQKKEKQ